MPREESLQGRIVPYRLEVDARLSVDFFVRDPFAIGSAKVCDGARGLTRYGRHTCQEEILIVVREPVRIDWL